ncbi:MAG: hypothetical protein HY314_11410 [Acidobacteria bacterium]|nr:hypothetical protein [Acidobacteriota bacterium]
MQFSLVDNALDYLLSAAEHAEQDTPRDWKYALLHLVAGIELLLKARLGEEHWSLLFADVDKTSETALQSGDFVSVDFNPAIKRLTDIAGVVLDPEDKKRLEELRRYRNRVQHFAIDIEREALLSVMACGYNFCLNFVRTQLNDLLDEKGQQLIHEVSIKLREFAEFVETRLAGFKGEIEGAYNYLIDCPRCWQETLVLGDGDPQCLFCGFTASPDEVAKEVNYEAGPEPCPECGGSCVRLGDQTVWVCFQCGNQGDYEFCGTCGELFSGEPMGGRCSACWERLLENG